MNSFTKANNAKKTSRMPLKIVGGKIVLAQDIDAIKSAVEKMLSDKFLGFDIECNSFLSDGKSYLPSLMQIALSSKVYLCKRK
jgi:hypothetical protein